MLRYFTGDFSDSVHDNRMHFKTEPLLGQTQFLEQSLTQEVQSASVV